MSNTFRPGELASFKRGGWRGLAQGAALAKAGSLAQATRGVTIRTTDREGNVVDVECPAGYGQVLAQGTPTKTPDPVTPDALRARAALVRRYRYSGPGATDVTLVLVLDALAEILERIERQERLDDHGRAKGPGKEWDYVGDVGGEGARP